MPGASVWRRTGYQTGKDEPCANRKKSTDSATLFALAARLRVNGTASIDESPAAIAGRPGAKRLARVAVEHIFTNCPRYIPKMDLQEPSVYAPKDGHSPPEPAWKSRDMVRDLFEKERGER